MSTVLISAEDFDRFQESDDEIKRLLKALERIESALTGVTAVGPDGALQIAKSALATAGESHT